MADNDDLDLEDGGSSPAPAKKGGFGGLLTGFLKWIIIGIAAVIVIVVISFVTAKLVMSHKTEQVYNPAGLQEYTGERESYDWYKSIGTIQTFTCDEPPSTVRVDVYLGYKKDDKAASAEITARSVEIKEFLRRYFRGKTASELKNVNNEDKFKIEIKNGINDKVLSTSRIRDVSFNEFVTVDQN